MEPHLLSIAQIIKKFSTHSDSGLTEEQAKKRLEQYGFNALPEKPPKSWVAIFFNQFQSPLIYILIFAAILSFIVIQDIKDSIIISIVIIFNAIIGTVQEGRARNVLASLKKFIISDCFVIREGKEVLIQDINIVPGDLILLQEGQRVPADARLIENNLLQVDEAILTGESAAVRKNTEIVEDEASLADRTNMVYKGTYVLSGWAKAIVVATGIHTEIGKIGALAQEEVDIPLKNEMVKLSHWILLFIFVFIICLFIIGFINGRPLDQLIVILTALAISVVPEGLPLVLTLVLVRGVYRMAKQNVLVKQMQAVEALGRTNVIAVDKTGTLTLNELIVTNIFDTHCFYAVSGYGYHSKGEVIVQGDCKKTGDNLQLIGIACSLLNTSHIERAKNSDTFTIKGDPTEAALFILSGKLGITSVQTNEYKKIFEIPFTPEARYHAGLFEKEGKLILFVIGSPEITFKHASNVDISLQNALHTMLNKGLRIVSIGYKELSVHSDQTDLAKFIEKEIQEDVHIIGIVGMQDSIRPHIKDSVSKARQAGLKVIMITGDHQKTALYVAKEVGIYTEGDRILDGPELHHLSDEEFTRIINTVTVYSRIAPADKMRIIKTFGKLGKIIAMTGDGINDVPSIVAADIGIAMGRMGTEITKESGDLVLLDDSFNSIINAIEQGRYIFSTIRRVILYFFATNMGEMLIICFALILNYPLPLTATQILWLNLVTDGFLDIALSTEPKEKGLLHKVWLKKKMHLIDINMLGKILYMSIPMAIGSIFIFSLYQCLNPIKAQTMTLLTLAMYQWFNAWNCRSETKSIFQLGLFSNPWLILSTFFVVTLQLLLIYTPWMQTIFDTVALNSDDWLRAFIVTLPLIVFEELRKWIVRRKAMRLH